jgi:glutathione synthase
MTIKLGVIMDPIEGIKASKDSTFAMLLEAQKRGYEIHYLQASDLLLKDGKIMAQCTQISVYDRPENWFEKHSFTQIDMTNLDIVLMRKDPPFNMEYIYTTYLLDRVQNNGTLVVNHPASLRNANEKLFATQFKDCITPYIVSQKQAALNEFIDEHKVVVVKPLDGMAGDQWGTHPLCIIKSPF